LRREAYFYALAFALAMLLVVQAVTGAIVESDTQLLVRGFGPILGCLRAGGQGACAGASHFALLQFLPTAAFYALGLRPSQALYALSLVSLACVLGMAAAGFALLRRRARSAGILWIALLAASPLLLYSRESFSETLAAACCFALAAALVESTSLQVAAACALLAGVSKETAPVLLLPLVFLAFRARPRPAFAVAAVAGLVLAAGVNGGFNLLRFGTWSNPEYALPIMRMHEAFTTISFFTAAFFSPAGGLVFFWPALSALLVAALWRRPRTYTALVLTVLSLDAAAFSLWYAPFGWIAWGDRLLIPWVCATAFLWLWTEHGAVADALSRLPRPTAAAALIGVAALPQLLVELDPRWVRDVFRAAPGCEQLPDLSNAAYYFGCIHAYLWRADATVFRIFAAIGENPVLAVPGFLFVVFFTLALPQRK
jgi:hypothetical protein